MKPAAFIPLAASGLILFGCSRGDENLTHVSGTVSYAGAAVPDGVIFFDPDPVANAGGVQGSAPIIEGRYNTAEPDGRPPTGGAVIVRVEGYASASAQHPEGRPLFPPYKEALELPRGGSATHDVTVPRRARP